MYQKVSTDMNFAQREEEVIKFWRDEDIFKKTVKLREGAPAFTFFDGPPTANGKPHIGHVETRAIKDIIPRYRTMKGYDVLRKAGWDTHGLPVELEVEKMLGLDGKPQIEEYGIEPFIKKCKESVWKYKTEWEQMSERVGYWADMEHPYITYEDNYIESEWWSLKKIYEKGLLYKGHKIVPYCPRCGTALSSHEVAQGYKRVEETSAVVRFKVKGTENTYLTAWTTTPWTLPSNVALCVNPKEDYVKVKADGSFYWLAEALVKALFEECEIVERVKGKELERTPYEPLFDWAGAENAYYVTCDGYVTLTDGSGIVHIAPAFGEDDAKVGAKYRLPFVQMVDERGCFTDDAGELKGIFCKKGDPLIIENLKNRGLLFKEQMYSHSYPFCWRCDTPLLYYARKSWFIRMSAVRDRLLESNSKINWMPESIGSGRMGNFLENVIDWGVSRERYWGTPLPVWVCEDCGEIHVVGSRKELSELSGCDESIELHRPYIDKVHFACKKCGGRMTRTPEVIDCWYDSGSMPFAQFHYPFENKELFQKNFPADFISEAVDQTRGWFYTLTAISTLLFDRAPFENCIVLGHVNDKNGIKMSKHKGNVVDPFSVLDVQGADAVRWYFYTSSAPWLPSRFYPEAVSEAQRKFLGTLWNTYAFFVLYADIDKFDPTKHKLSDCCLTVMDRWVLSELNSLVKLVDEGLERYEITETARAIEEFADKVSNWYVRRGRERYWGSEWTKDKEAAYVTLYTVLTTLARVAAPYVPFVTESMYQNLVRSFDKDAPVSVHLCDFPACDENYIDKRLEEDMEELLDVVVLGRSARNAGNLKNRQPLAKMYVVSDKIKNMDNVREILLDELNVKQAEFVSDGGDFVSYEIKPQLKTLGPKYGALLGKIRQFLATCDGAEIVRAVKKGGSYKTELDGKEIELFEDDLLISTKDAGGFFAASDKGLTVVLDANLTPELVKEGLARELVSKIQTMRKESGFVVTDHITMNFSADDEIKAVLQEFGDEIGKDTLCDKISEGREGESVKEWNVNGHVVTIALSRTNKTQ